MELLRSKSHTTGSARRLRADVQLRQSCQSASGGNWCPHCPIGQQKVRTFLCATAIIFPNNQKQTKNSGEFKGFSNNRGLRVGLRRVEPSKWVDSNWFPLTKKHTKWQTTKTQPHTKKEQSIRSLTAEQDSPQGHKPSICGLGQSQRQGCVSHMRLLYFAVNVCKCHPPALQSKHVHKGKQSNPPHPTTLPHPNQAGPVAVAQIPDKPQICRARNA